MRSTGGVDVLFHDAFAIGNTPMGLEINGTEGSLIGVEVLRQDPIGEVVLRRGDEVTPVDVGERGNLYVRGIPWGSETPIRSRGATVVLADEAAEQVAPADVLRADGQGVRSFGERDREVEPAMGPPAVVVGGIGPERPVRVAAAEDH